MVMRITLVTLNLIRSLVNERLRQPAVPPWDGTIPKPFKLSSDEELKETHIAKKIEKQRFRNV